MRAPDCERGLSHTSDHRSLCRQKMTFRFQVLNAACPIISTGDLNEGGTAAHLYGKTTGYSEETVTDK
eukprot:478171-Amphidinium_carterae.4